MQESQTQIKQKSGKVIKFFSFAISFLLLASSLLVNQYSYANDKLHIHKVNNDTPLRVAVSSNFSPVLNKLIPLFLKQSGIRTEIISGSSATLYQQIKHGAPYDLFLSADHVHPQRLSSQSLTIKNSLQTYALGQLAFWSANKTFNNTASLSTILKNHLEHSSKIAIANPDIAPYGQRAKETLKALSLWNSFQDKVITGINVNQTFQQIRSQSVKSGFVALSQLQLNNLQGIIVPDTLYSPIKQQLVILKQSKQPSSAKMLVEFLQQPSIQKRIAQYGYKVRTDNE